MSTRQLKVLIYCQDSYGLGHLRRNVNIAHALHRLDPSISTLFVADSPLAPFFTLPPNSDFIKLPTLVKVDAGVWETPKLPLPVKRTRKMRAQMLKKIVLQYQPNAVLVDHMPHGAMRELIAALKAIRRKLPHTQTILGLRDILGAPETIIRQWEKEGAYQAIADYYDAIMIYGCQELYDLAREYQFSADLHQRVYYCGYVFDPEVGPMNVSLSEHPREKNTRNGMANGTEPRGYRRQLHNGTFPGRKRHQILVVGGGGSDAQMMMQTSLDAIRQLNTEIPFDTLMFTGPFMPVEDRNALVHKSADLPVTVKWMDNDVRRYFPKADLVISMAGYNTITEIMGYAKRAVVVPRLGPSAEQSIRCEILHERGIIHSIHPDDLTAEHMAQVIAQRLSEGQNGHRPLNPSLDGATKVAEAILEGADRTVAA